MVGLGDLGGLLKGMRHMQEKVKEMQETLDAQEVEGQAGGGMVVVRASGRGEIRSVTIKAEAVDPGNVEVLEDMVLAAVRQALEKSQELLQQEMRKATGGLNIPGLDNLLSGF